MYVLLLLLVIKSNPTLQSFMLQQTLFMPSSLNADNKTGIAARPHTRGALLLYLYNNTGELLFVVY